MKINSEGLGRGFALFGKEGEEQLITLPGESSNKEVADLHPAEVLFSDEKFQRAFAIYQRMKETTQNQTVTHVQENTQVRENN